MLNAVYFARYDHTDVAARLGHVHHFLFETKQQAYPVLFITLTQVLEEFICKKNKYQALAKLVLLLLAAE